MSFAEAAMRRGNRAPDRPGAAMLAMVFALSWITLAADPVAAQIRAVSTASIRISVELGPRFTVSTAMNRAPALARPAGGTAPALCVSSNGFAGFTATLETLRPSRLQTAGDAPAAATAAAATIAPLSLCPANAQTLVLPRTSFATSAAQDGDSLLLLVAAQ